MKNDSFNPWLARAAALLVLGCVLLPAAALAYDAHSAAAWLEQFAAALSAIEPLNRPQDTADPARAGQFLIEYPFGTVTAGAAQRPSAQQITSIDVRSDAVTDCRGVRVGMSLSEALGGRAAGESSTQLYVLDTQQDGFGWSWAYVDGRNVYGVEYISYAGDAAAMKEYTLTYVIEEDRIAAIRMCVADATQAQAEEGLKTAREIASRQHGEVLAAANQASVFGEADLTVNGVRTLGMDVASVAVRLGEPAQIQTLPEAEGRILLYDGAAIALALDEYTGVERVRSVSVSGEGFQGPRGLSVGMTVQEAASLFFCEADVSSRGGALYLQGEALGEAPYGELLVTTGGETLLRYACMRAGGVQAVLEAGVQDGGIAYWRLYDAGDTAEGGV